MKQSKFLSTLGIAIILSVSLQSCNSLDSQSKLIGIQQISPTEENIAQEVMADIKVSQNFSDFDPFGDIPVKFDLKKSALLTDTAKFLAGMRLGNSSQFIPFQQTNDWQEHRRFLNNAWGKFEAEQLSSIRQWQKTELQTIDSSIYPIFYPFSNANFAQIYSLFPNSKEFILTGIEPVGKIPDLSTIKPAKLTTSLQKIRSYIYTILPLDYFRSQNNQNLQIQEVLPALYVFMARMNNRLIDLEYVGIDQDGIVQPYQSGMISGVKITFVTPGNSDVRLLYYFASDLSNEGIKAKPELIRFISNYNNIITYIQGASYLMHFDSFDQIKKLILSQSAYLLQDDSGIPLSAFELEKWELSFYGNYTQPSSIFRVNYQPQLRQIYTSKQHIKSLTFGTGYQLQPERSNLMLAKVNSIKNKLEFEKTQSLKTQDEFVK